MKYLEEFTVHSAQNIGCLLSLALINEARLTNETPRPHGCNFILLVLHVSPLYLHSIGEILTAFLMPHTQKKSILGDSFRNTCCIFPTCLAYTFS